MWECPGGFSIHANMEKAYINSLIVPLASKDAGFFIRVEVLMVRFRSSHTQELKAGHRLKPRCDFESVSGNINISYFIICGITSMSLR